MTNNENWSFEQVPFIRYGEFETGKQMLDRGEERRNAIVQAALRVLVRDGAHGFRMRAIASEAGIGLSHVQYYFKKIDLVLAAVVESHLQEWDAVMKDAPSDLEGAVEFVLRKQKERDDCQLLWELWALSGRDATANDALVSFYTGYIDRVCALIKACLPHDYGDECIRSRATLIVALIEGWSVLRGNDREKRLAGNTADHLTSAIYALAALPIANR
ncbi:TetR/AcrR family transcriptional regulator [Bosea sp. 2KB_26]|uniref:TetR/AcrR family transcriptional regulator n=1 Tax=Bosea sp. 2KB_26 TaxID=3237475 RepID=UPI003F916CD4